MANCTSCGMLLDGNSRICGGCGMPLENGPQPLPIEAAERLSPNILREPDGVYRWVYELSLFKNPTILFMLWRILGGIFAGIFLFMFILQAVDFGLVRALEDIGLFPVWFLLGMVLLTSLAYAVYALIMGGSYCVLFEMNEKGVRHTQLPKQFKKAQTIGRIGFWMGLATGNLSMAGQGLITASRQSMHTSFSNVKRIVPLERRGVIKLNETLHRNQVYADKEDFEEVLEYIRNRCPKAKR